MSKAPYLEAAEIPISERQFQALVIELARLEGWEVFSLPDSRRVTSSGFPDLVIIHPPRILFRELKTEKGKLSERQVKWLKELNECQVDAGVWRPSDWETIKETLRVKF